MISRWIFATLLLLCSVFAEGQGVRWDLGSPGSAGAVTVGNGPGFPPLYAMTGVQLNWCNHPANSVPCTNYATTYTSITLNTSCPVNAQVVLQGSSTCQGTSDNFGNLGVWTASNTVCTSTCYDYTLTVNGVSSGPFVWIAGGGSGGFSQGTASTVGWQAISPSSPEVDIPIDPTGTCSYNPNILTGGEFKICNPGNGQLWGDPGSGPLLFFMPQIPTAGSLINGAVPQYVAANNDYEILPLAQTSVLVSAQTSAMVPDVSTGSDNYTCWGMFASQCVADTKNSFAHLNPTGSANWGRTLTSAASGSTSTVIGMHSTENGSNSLAGIVSFSRLAQKIQINNTTNARWWIGICVWNSGSSLGSNSAQCDGTTAYAANLPNKTTMGFRLSGGTDSTWQCVSIVAGSGSPTSTVVDTLITPDITAPHIYEIDTNANGTALYCLIDRVIVATITTNLPAPGSTADTWGSPFWTGDNENTATAISATWYSTTVSYK